jgi:hypothetical protein
MKRTILAVAAFLALSAAAAEAPAKGGSAPRPEKKEQVQCWAVTKSGNRCTRRARPDERYCKQHSSSVAPKKPPAQCMSMTEKGKQCENKPAEGKRYCSQHQ